MVRRSYVSECEIDAPVEEVWAALVDFGRYPEWNTFTPRVRCSLRIGEPVDMRVYLTSYRLTISQRETVVAVAPRERIVWGTTMLFGAVRAERAQTVTVTGAARTRYRTKVVIEGPMRRLVHWLMGPSIQSGLDAVASGLARHVARRSSD